MVLDDLKEFLRIVLICHQSHTSIDDDGEFDANTLLKTMGFGDWTRSKELTAMMEHYEGVKIDEFFSVHHMHDRSEMLDSSKLTIDLCVHRICAHRLGAALKSALEQYFTDQYIVLPNKNPGRFGGKTVYRWEL